MMKTEKVLVNIAGWLDASCDDGPGIRSVLFFQGCSKNCPGCHNAETHDPKAGKKYELKNLIAKIEHDCQMRMITISGGEPLEQMDALKKLLAELKQRNYNICLYTGWSERDVPKSILNLVDYLKVGGFVKQLHRGDLQYYGSTNQKMYQISNGKPIKEVA